jgi:hypothetical protein
MEAERTAAAAARAEKEAEELLFEPPPAPAMNERWEYKLISWASATQAVQGTPPSGMVNPKKYLWKNEFVIKGPGEELESRLGYSDYEEDTGARTVKIQDLLNEFGAEGWELISETILDTTIVGNHAGWSKIGTPVEIRWILKRRVETQDEDR